MSVHNTSQDRFSRPAGWLWDSFQSARGGSLRSGRLPVVPGDDPHVHVIYVMGLSEFCEKKFELARDFNRMAINFHVFDRYGQGKSPRYLSNPYKQHAKGIEKDLADIAAYRQQFIPAGDTVFLLGHSTGGLLALHAQQKYPALFRGTILTSPLLGMKTPLVRTRESFVAKLKLPSFITSLYIPGGRDNVSRRDLMLPLKEQDFSSDPIRNKLHQDLCDSDPDLRSGSPTIGWVLTMCRAIDSALKPAFAAQVSRPICIFTAGDDKLVDNRNTGILAGRLPSASMTNFPGAKHELLMETDDIRDCVLQKTNDFILRNV